MKTIGIHNIKIRGVCLQSEVQTVSPSDKDILDDGRVGGRENMGGCGPWRGQKHDSAAER